MAGTPLPPGEQRARGQRLIVIFVVIAVLLVAGVAWRTWTNHALTARTDDARGELRTAYRDLDIPAASDRWNDAALHPATPVLGIWPDVDHAQLRDGEVRADRIRARYEVSAAGMRRCLAVDARPGSSHNVVTVVTVGC